MLEINHELFKERRKKRGLSLRQVADDTGVSPQTVLNLEKGDANTQARVLGTLAAYYQISTAKIFLKRECLSA